jgi:hypothetical protein
MFFADSGGSSSTFAARKKREREKKHRNRERIESINERTMIYAVFLFSIRIIVEEISIRTTPIVINKF